MKQFNCWLVLPDPKNNGTTAIVGCEMELLGHELRLRTCQLGRITTELLGLLPNRFVLPQMPRPELLGKATGRLVTLQEAIMLAMSSISSGEE